LKSTISRRVRVVIASHLLLLARGETYFWSWLTVRAFAANSYLFLAILLIVGISRHPQKAQVSHKRVRRSL
jgi:hypothetical protein